jgi:hypothetical protein
MQTPTPSGNRPGAPPKEEPEITQEESVPSDGRDEVGEDMMEELGRDKAAREREKGRTPGP